MKKAAVHWRAGRTLTPCGLYRDRDHTTRNESDVTCGRCRIVMQLDVDRGVRLSPAQTSTGRGVLRCLVCGQPLRDHKLTRPCHR